MDRRHMLRAVGAGLAGAMLPLARAADRIPMLRGFTLPGGELYQLAQERGKVVLLFFWSTACAVCRDKLPELRLNHESWRAKGFQLVAVNVDPRPEDLMRYIELTGHLVPPSQRFPMLWRGARGHTDNLGALAHTPTSFVIDRSGKVVKELHGRIEPALWDDIAELLLG